MENITCHSNQRSYPTEQKHNLCKGKCQPCMQCIIHPSYDFSKDLFTVAVFFSKIYPLPQAWQLIEFSDLDKTHMKNRGLPNKYFCKIIQKTPLRQKILSISTFPIISLSNICCHSNQSSYPIETRKQFM